MNARRSPVDAAGGIETHRSGAVSAVCDVCGGRCQGFLCSRCLGELERALGDVPADLEDLEAVATRQASGPLGLGDPARQWDGPAEDGALGDASWVFAPGAADLIDAIGNTITTWARHLAEGRGVELPAWVRSTVDAARWLMLNRHVIAQDEAASQIHDEITSIPIAVSRNVLGAPPADEFYGLCDDPDVRVDQAGDTLTPVVGRCGTQLFGARNAQQIDCPVCGASYTREQRHTSMLAELTDTLGTVRQVASTLTTLGKPVTVHQIDGWVRRGFIASRGGVPKLVRVGDVLERREAVLKRGSARRKTTAA